MANGTDYGLGSGLWTADLSRARSEACYAAYHGGLVVTKAGTALHHKIRQVLGGRYNLPHAMLHAIVLPQAVA